MVLCCTRDKCDVCCGYILLTLVLIGFLAVALFFLSPLILKIYYFNSEPPVYNISMSHF